MTLPEQKAQLVRGSWILTMGSAGSIKDGAVKISEGRIEEVGNFDSLRIMSPGADVVGDGSGIVTPGMINTHTHLSEALVTGMGSEMTLFEWGRNIVTPVGDHLTEEMAEVGTVLKGAEMLRSGVTYVNDMFVHSNAGSKASLGVVAGLRSCGLRGSVSFGAENAQGSVTATEPMSDDEIMSEHVELAAAAASADLDFRYGIGTLLGQTDRLLDLGIETCRAEGWAVHTHLAEVREEVVHSSLRWGERPVAHALQTGLLDLEVLAAHVIWVTEEEISALASRPVAIAHNPVANMILGSGVAPVPRLRAAGLAVGIGTDGAASNDSQNMLEAVKIAALLQKVSSLDPSVISARDVLAMATLEGARALSIDSDTGSLEPGKSADVVLLEGTEEVAVIHDPYQQVVFGSSPKSVSDVWVSGRHVVRKGKIATVDLPDQMFRATELASELSHRSGLCEKGLSRLCTMH